MVSQSNNSFDNPAEGERYETQLVVGWIVAAVDAEDGIQAIPFVVRGNEATAEPTVPYDPRDVRAYFPQSTPLYRVSRVGADTLEDEFIAFVQTPPSRADALWSARAEVVPVKA